MPANLAGLAMKDDRLLLALVFLVPRPAPVFRTALRAGAVVLQEAFDGGLGVIFRIAASVRSTGRLRVVAASNKG